MPSESSRQSLTDRAERPRLLLGNLGPLLGLFGLYLGLRLLTPHDFLGVLAALLDRQHLELLDRVGHRADLVLTVEPGQDDVEVATGELEHGLLDRHQRPRSRAA